MTLTAIQNIGRLFGTPGDGVVEHAAVLIEDGAIVWAGRETEMPREGIEDSYDADGALVTPGLIDCHTHPVYGGGRMSEISARSEGLSYSQLGSDAGIGATVRATRSLSEEDLRTLVRQRLGQWLEGGATTVEAKTGYLLNEDGELAAVSLLDSMRSIEGLPDIYVTFLAAHAIPPEARSADAYIEACASWSKDAALRGADACDVFCDEGYFTVEQSRTILSAGAGARLGMRIHADELARSGGSLLAAELGCDSADHLLKITEEDARALGNAGVTATLCPGTALSIGSTPDLEALREAGVTFALGSDHNPGTCGITSMALVVSLAVAALGMSVSEALEAATLGGAVSLGLQDRGVIERGKRADIVVWDADHEGVFAWAWGPKPATVFRAV
jgi:imidazolonepropionase